MSMYAKAKITLKDGTAVVFEANDESSIADFLYEMVGEKLEESNGIPMFIEASSWCPMACIGDTFENKNFTIEITE